jgi:hypothetical protein
MRFLPEFEFDENGTYWENAMGESWEPIYAITKERELQEMFRDYMNHNKVEE